MIRDDSEKLAEDTQANISFDERERLLERAMARHHYAGAALIEVLHTAQQLYGHLSKPLLRTIARKLKLPPSKVLGVASFYHLFRFAPCKKHTAVACLGTACYAAGGDALMATLQTHCAANSLTWNLEIGRCVGSCGLAPVVIFDGVSLSRVSPAGLEARLKEAHDS